MRRLGQYSSVSFPLPWRGVGSFAPDTQPIINSSGAVIQIPLPGGTQVGVTVTPNTPRDTAIVPADTISRLKSWANERSIIAGYENWKVLGAGLLAFALLRRK